MQTKRLRILTVLLCSMLPVLTSAQVIRVDSPNGKISYYLENADAIRYRVDFDGQPLIAQSDMGFQLRNERRMGDSLMLESPCTAVSKKEHWTPAVCNRHSQVDIQWNEATLHLRETTQSRRKMDIEVRVFNEGVAFRYHLFADEHLQTREILSEQTQFALPPSAKAYVAEYHPRYRSPQEGEFFKRPLTDLSNQTLAALPLLTELDGNRYLAITEAYINNYPGFYLSGSDGLLHTMLSPLPGETEDGVKARFDDDIYTPWRVILISDSPGSFIESEIVRTLNPPCALSDTSWIQPGLCAWDHWWSGEVKMETSVIKEYIDLAAEESWPYMLIDWQWYGSYNRADTDITKPAPQLDFPEILAYAKEKGVRLWLWLYSSDVNRNDAYKQAFAQYEQWGIAGVKIDFMDRDDQYMANWYRRIVDEAAKHHLMVDFHGAYKSDGIERTYPNFMTREGVMGNEYNKWNNGISSEHNVKLAFTRMIAGPMDYTPGGFLNVSPSEYKAQSPTMVPNTRCAELSKFVIYESPFTVVCDHPKHILGQAGADFLKSVPTTWDDIRFLQGSPDEYIAMAKRNGDLWYIGVMNTSEPREIVLDLSFLGETDLMIEYWADGKRPTDVIHSTFKVKRDKKLKIKLASNGGYVAIIK